MAIDCGTAMTMTDTSTTANRTLNSTSNWTTHLTTNNFTTGALSWIRADVSLVHGYESGAVNVTGRLLLNNGSASPEQQLFCQGIGGNKAFGAHNMSWTWYNVGAGTHHVDLEVINKSSGTTGITCYFHPGSTGLPDQLMVTYHA